MSSTLAPKEVHLILSRRANIPPALLSDEACGRQTVFELYDDGSTVTVGPVDARTLGLLVSQSRFFENMFKWGFKVLSPPFSRVYIFESIDLDRPW